MPRPVLHIGMAKCASTYLHDNLAHQSIAFGAFSGFDALSPLVDEAMVRASGYRYGALTPKPVDEVTRQFAAWRLRMARPDIQGDSPRALMLSNECVTGVYPFPARFTADSGFDAAVMKAFQRSAAELLAQTFPRATIVLLVRRPAGWLRSVYNNLVTMGLADQGAGFEDRHHAILEQWYALDELVGLYRGHFGTENVHVIPIELARADPARFQRRLSAAYGFPLKLPVPFRNRSLPTGALDKLRDVNALIDEISPPDGRWEAPNTYLKHAIWRFCFEAVMNDADAHDAMKARFGEAPAFFTPPPDMVERLWAGTEVLTQALEGAGLPRHA